MTGPVRQKFLERTSPEAAVLGDVEEDVPGGREVSLVSRNEVQGPVGGRGHRDDGQLVPWVAGPVRARP